MGATKRSSMLSKWELPLAFPNTRPLPALFKHSEMNVNSVFKAVKNVPESVSSSKDNVVDLLRIRKLVHFQLYPPIPDHEAGRWHCS